MKNYIIDKKSKLFYESWYYLESHNCFKDSNGYGRFQETLDIYITHVNPKTKEIDNDGTKNISIEVWLEAGEWICPGHKDYIADTNDPSGLGYGCHNPDLDCGSKTFEKAIIKLAKLVKKKIIAQ